MQLLRGRQERRKMSRHALRKPSQRLGFQRILEHYLLTRMMVSIESSGVDSVRTPTSVGTARLIADVGQQGAGS